MNRILTILAIPAIFLPCLVEAGKKAVVCRIDATPLFTAVNPGLLEPSKPFSRDFSAIPKGRDSFNNRPDVLMGGLWEWLGPQSAVIHKGLVHMGCANQCTMANETASLRNIPAEQFDWPEFLTHRR